MTTTRPTSEQLRFNSVRTGEHILDAYLEASELGNRTLADLLSDVFTTSGTLRSDIIQLRVTAAGALEYRAGTYADPNFGWLPVSGGEIFRQRGAYAIGAVYARTDVVTHNGSTFTCTVAHTASMASPDPTKFNIAVAPDLSLTVRHDVAQSLTTVAQGRARTNIDAAQTSHTHTIFSIPDLQATLDGKAGLAHTHSISDVTALQTTLDAKAPTSHTHTAAQISDSTITGRAVLTAVDAAAARATLGAAPTAHTHTRADISDASAFGRTLLDRADATAARTHLGATTLGSSLFTAADAPGAQSALGLVIGTNVQAQSPILSAAAGLTPAADQIPFFTSATTISTAALTPFIRGLLDDANAAAARTTLAAAPLDAPSFTGNGSISGSFTAGTSLSAASLSISGASNLTGDVTTSGAFLQNGWNLAPRPRSTAAVGQFVNMNVDATSISLPANGTWAYCVLTFNASNQPLNSFVGVDPGGTQIVNNAQVARIRGFAWRITV